MKKRSVAAIVLGVIAVIAALFTLPSEAMIEFVLDEVPRDAEEVILMMFQILKVLIIIMAVVTALCVALNTKKGANIALIIFGVIEIMLVLPFFVGLFSIISGAVANSHIKKYAEFQSKQQVEEV